MNRLKALAITSCLGLLAVAFLPASKADEWNKKTFLTINEPLAVPGKVLQPGKYVMKLMDSQSNRHIVQIYNEDESQLQTTVLAIPNYRLEPTGKTQFGFWEMPAGQPRALKAWFYPGDNFGQEFAYPKEVATTIASTNNQPVPTVNTDNTGNYANAEVGVVQPNGQSSGLESCNCGMNQNETAKNQTSTTEQSAAATQPSTTEQNATTSKTDTSSTAESTTTPSTTEQSMNQSSSTAQSTTTTPSPESTTSAQTTNPSTTSGSMSSTAGTTTAEQTPSNTANQPAYSNNANATAATNTSLPRTASPFPLVGLAGLFSLGAALAVRVISKIA